MRTVVLATLLLLALPGCGDDRDDEIYVHRTERHICARDCHHHYYDGGGRLVVIEGHRHGPNCGHRWDNNRWVIIRTGGASRAHVCTRACDHHYYDGRKLVVLKGHRHGPNCGHRWEGRHWIVASTRATARAPRAHVCTRACNHYYDGRRIVALKGHRHSPNCGHRWDGRRWVGATVQPQRRVIRRR